MILGPDGKTPVQTEHAQTEAQKRCQELCEKVYVLFTEDSVTFVEGADVAANLLVNLVENQPTANDAREAAKQVIGNLTHIFQGIIQKKAEHEKVRSVLQRANPQHRPS